MSPYYSSEYHIVSVNVIESTNLTNYDLKPLTHLNSAARQELPLLPLGPLLPLLPLLRPPAAC